MYGLFQYHFYFLSFGNPVLPYDYPKKPEIRIFRAKRIFRIFRHTLTLSGDPRGAKTVEISGGEIRP